MFSPFNNLDNINIVEKYTKNNNDVEPFNINDVINNSTYQNASPIDKYNYYQANLLESIYEINKEYNNYTIHCLNKDKNTIVNTVSGDITCNDLNTKINNDGNLIIDHLNNNSSVINNLQDKSVTDASYQYINSNYNDLTKKRKELDLKLSELYDINNSRNIDNTINFDSTIYTGIVVTLILSVLVYYTLKKI